MQYWRTFAFVKDDLVRDISVFAPDGAYTAANDRAKTFHGSRAFAVDVTQIPVAIGDRYIAGRFYRNEEEIKSLPTDEQEIAEIKSESESLSTDLSDVMLALVEISEALGA